MDNVTLRNSRETKNETQSIKLRTAYLKKKEKKKRKEMFNKKNVIKCCKKAKIR